MLKSALWFLAAAALVCGCGGDDDDDNQADGGTGGVAGGGGAGGGGHDLYEDPDLMTFLTTEIHLNAPAGVATILSNLLNTNLQAEKMYLLVQVKNFGATDGSEVILQGGAGQYVAGKETEDWQDDVFTWLTSGTCLDESGHEFECSVDVGRGVCTTGENWFEADLDVLNIYSDDVLVIFPIKRAHIKGTIEEDTVTLDMQGVIIKPETETTHFRLTPGAPLTTLAKVLTDAQVQPDTQVEITKEDGSKETVDAYTFGGILKADLSRFAE